MRERPADLESIIAGSAPATLIIRVAVAGGIIAGLLDIAYAIGVYALRGVPPVSILQAVASGVLGRDAYSAGLFSATIGTILHFSMTVLMSLVFALGATRMAALRRRPVLSGMGYGLLLFALMNYVVVPHSLAYPGKAPQGLMLLGALTAHVFLVGLPISLTTRRYLEHGSLQEGSE